MNTKVATIVAAAVPALLSVSSVFAGEVPFHTPNTDRARESQVVLAQAATALQADVARTGQGQIKDLWLFPTADQDTVFASYSVSDPQPTLHPQASQTHLQLLRVSGQQLVEQKELTQAATEELAHSPASNVAPHWTAWIGSGHALSNESAPVLDNGVRASAHWTAKIGSGRASDSDTSSQELNASTASR